MMTASRVPGTVVGLTMAVTRAVAVLAAIGALSAGYLMALASHTAHRPADVPGQAVDTGHDVWKASYSRRFPGCVAVVLWPADEVPRALVVRNGRGDLVQMSVREAAVRVRGQGRSGDLTTVGVCRR